MRRLSSNRKLRLVSPGPWIDHQLVRQRDTDTNCGWERSLPQKPNGSSVVERIQIQVETNQPGEQMQYSSIGSISAGFRSRLHTDTARSKALTFLATNICVKPRLYSAQWHLTSPFSIGLSFCFHFSFSRPFFSCSWSLLFTMGQCRPFLLAGVSSFRQLTALFSLGFPKALWTGESACTQASRVGNTDTGHGD